MSPVNNFGILAFASVVLAIPHGHEAHRHLHVRGAPPAYGASSPSEGTAAPYPVPSGAAHPSGWGMTGTGWGTGTGWAKPTGFPAAPVDGTCGPETTTTCIWRDHTSVSTITVSPSPAAPAASPPAGSPPAGSPAAAAPSPQDAAVCARDVTVTQKVTSTVTVTAGGAPSEPSAPSGEDKGADGSAPTLGSAPPSYSTGSGSTPEAANTTSAFSTQPTGRTASPFSGKRGLAYNDVSDTTPFLASPEVGWGYNWVSSSGGLSSKIQYIPELHDGTSTFTSSWASDAQSAIDAGAQYLFGFNEPDMVSQANMSPQEAATAWMQYMQPFAGKAKLVAPAVTNSGSPGEGLDWLSQFMSACSGCTIDAVNQHWYDTTSNDISLLQQQVSQANSQSGLPVFVGEFGFIGADSDIASALTQAMSWMDGNDNVLGYAYYMDASGFLLNGDVPSEYGATYMGSGAGTGAISSAIGSAPLPSAT